MYYLWRKSWALLIYTALSKQNKKKWVHVSLSIWCSSTSLISSKYMQQRTWLRALTIFAFLTCPAVTMLFLDLITLLIVSHSSTETPHQQHSSGKTAIWVNIGKNNGLQAQSCMNIEKWHQVQDKRVTITELHSNILRTVCSFSEAPY